MSRTFVFGYGSLVSANPGLNTRFMKRRYRERDLTECALTGYARSFNAVYRGTGYDKEEERTFEWSSRFFGIAPQVGGRVNGIIFPLDKRDIGPFVSSEGGDKVYNFVNLRSQIIDLPEGILQEDDHIFVCVTKNPSYDGYVSNNYIDRCNAAIRHRSDAWRAEFGDIYNYQGAPERPKPFKFNPLSFR